MSQKKINTCLNCGGPAGKDFAFCTPKCKKEYQDKKKEQTRNEAVHKLIGVDGWQEVYSDAPSEEDIRQEVAEDTEKEIREQRH